MELKLGDKIYFFKYGKYPICFETIIKKTPTMFKTQNYTLKIFSDDWIKIVGKPTWDNTTAQKENETNKALWEEHKIISWFDNKKFTTEEKNKVYKLFNL